MQLDQFIDTVDPYWRDGNLVLYGFTGSGQIILSVMPRTRFMQLVRRVSVAQSGQIYEHYLAIKASIRQIQKPFDQWNPGQVLEDLFHLFSLRLLFGPKLCFGTGLLDVQLVTGSNPLLTWDKRGELDTDEVAFLRRLVSSAGSADGYQIQGEDFLSKNVGSSVCFTGARPG